MKDCRIVKLIELEEFKNLSSSELGITEWVSLGQDKVNQFAEVTQDSQYIHVDPVAAKDTVFGGTIVHGFYLLALIPKFQAELLPEVKGTQAVMNYGLNKVRFLTPVLVESCVRGKITMKEISERNPGQYLVRYEIVVEIEGQDTPALVAEQLCLFVTS